MPPGCVAWWLLLPLAVFSLATATDLQPNVTGDVTLTTAGSPWVVKNTVYVEETGSLTVEPGVTVLMASGASLLVYGQLVADGTESDHIQFTLLDSRNKTEGKSYHARFAQQAVHCIHRNGGIHALAHMDMHTYIIHVYT